MVTNCARPVYECDAKPPEQRPGLSFDTDAVDVPDQLGNPGLRKFRLLVLQWDKAPALAGFFTHRLKQQPLGGTACPPPRLEAAM